MPLPPPFEARLAAARALTAGVRELAFERLDGQPMVFEAGQWVNVLLPAEVSPTPDDATALAPERVATPTKRSYSIASAPDGSPGFAIAVTRVQGGPVSTWLHEVEPGTVLRFVGPQGFFVRAPSAPWPSLMIATGTGVTPMRSMIRAALAAGSTAPLWLLLGVRQEADLLYAAEFADAVRAHASVRFEATLSQPDAGWKGRRGYVQTHVPELWEKLTAVAPGARPHAYVCGLQRMVGSVRDLLRGTMGLPREQVHSERYD